MSQPAPTCQPHREALAALVEEHGRELPLDQAAALLSAEECPDASPDHTLAMLDALASRLHIPDGIDIYEQVARINYTLFEAEGFIGDQDTYDDPINSRLDKVLERRQGLPILLSLVFIEVARRHGLSVDGVSFPGHFIVAPTHSRPRFYIDPFHQGTILKDLHLRERLARAAGTAEVDADAWKRFTGAVDPASILQRMNNNLKRSWARRGDLHGALRAVDRNLTMVPDSPNDVRDRGMLLVQLGHRAEGITWLERYLHQEPSAWDAERIEQSLTFLKRRG